MSHLPSAGERECDCTNAKHHTKFIVVTGGPGAGKTAILEMAKKNFCSHVAILPEGASIVFGGGFWRLDAPSARRAAQRAIYHIQREMERLVTENGNWALALCDRGTLDGLAYWPGLETDFWRDVDSGLATELERYQAVIHLRTPTVDHGYNHQNSLRIETAQEARVIDDRIAAIWSAHPRYVAIESSPNFLEKAQAALALIEAELPACCRAPI